MNKLKQDLPVFAVLDSDQLTVEVEKRGFDVLMIYVRIASVLVPLGRPTHSNQDAITLLYDGKTF